MPSRLPQIAIGAALLLIVVATVLGTIFFYGSARSSLVELRSDDLCPKDASKPPPAVYAILIDQTDPVAPLAQQSIVNALLVKLRSYLEGADAGGADDRHALVEVWTFSNEGKNVTTVGDVRVATERVLSMCNPGTPGEWDRLYRNVDVVRRQHGRLYSTVEDTLRRSLSFPEAKQSPVIEALYATGVQVFSKPEFVRSRKSLFVVSDLLQNTPNLTMFAGKVFKYEAWVATPQGQRALPDLRNVRVDALVLPTNRAELQSQDFFNFWIALFKGAGAAPVELRRVR